MAPKRKANLQTKGSTESADVKRVRDEESIDVAQADTKKTDNIDMASNEVAVDYGDVDVSLASTVPGSAPATSGDNVQITASHDIDEKLRITKALQSWCRNNIVMEAGDVDGDDRVSALAEVGLLLVFEQAKYPDAPSMKIELEDIGSIIGGDDVVKKYINFILSLQNQLKKVKYQAERQMRHHHHQQQPPFQPMAHYPYQGGVMAQGGPVFYQQMNPMFAHPMQHHAPPMNVGNRTLNTTGEMTAVQKQRERERKRKEILAECTEHMKALLERVTRSTDTTEKAKIYELIDKVKKRIDSLKEVPAPTQKPSNSRGYFGNQYVNPNLNQQNHD